MCQRSAPTWIASFLCVYVRLEERSAVQHSIFIGYVPDLYSIAICSHSLESLSVVCLRRISLSLEAYIIRCLPIPFHRAFQYNIFSSSAYFLVDRSFVFFPLFPHPFALFCFFGRFIPFHLWWVLFRSEFAVAGAPRDGREKRNYCPAHKCIEDNAQPSNPIGNWNKVAAIASPNSRIRCLRLLLWLVSVVSALAHNLPTADETQIYRQSFVSSEIELVEQDETVLFLFQSRSSEAANRRK